MVLATPDIASREFSMAGWVAVLVTYTVFRTIRPISPEATLGRLVGLTAEAALVATAVAATGYFRSPLAFSSLTAIAVAGFAAGFANALRLAVASAMAIGLPMLVSSTQLDDDRQLVVQWSVELLLVGVVAGYARRISGDADVRHSEALDRMDRLADANDLLISLHEVAQDLPSSLDLDEVLDSTVARLRELLDLDSAAILLREDSDQSWSVARRFGGRALTTSTLSESELPAPARRASESTTVVSETNLIAGAGPGLAMRAGSGMYVALRARGSVVGVALVEHPEPFHFSQRDADLLDGFAEPAALAIDNARWFARLRTVGADEERTRIARDLHDRIGQSLAYLAFELDRIVRNDSRGQRVTDDLVGIRSDVRGVVREVRDTLYDLRTDVSDERTVGDALQEFGSRVEERSGMTFTLRVDESARMPRPQERELWRIAQEAIVNAERHSGGTRIDVFWFSNGFEAVAEVRDDGEGMPIGRVGRLNSYGMLGMRERATAIGANLSVDSVPNRGVTMRVAVRKDR
ncbi:sensor histidine kinase [Actinospongicola halichondriae]|uniref:sensor histidine kinase n=1 Tax=Actinospongicola halichondriae TaxID=3236844 RepID=UPI003D58DC83